MDRATSKKIADELNAFAAQLAAKYGCEFQRGSGTYTQTDVKLSMMFVEQGARSRVEKRQDAMLAQMARRYGLDLNKVAMTVDGPRKLERYNTKGKTYKYILKDPQTGKLTKATQMFVLKYFVQ